MVTIVHKALRRIGMARQDNLGRAGQAELCKLSNRPPLVNNGCFARAIRKVYTRLHLDPACRAILFVIPLVTAPYRLAFVTPASSLRRQVNGAAQSIVIVSLECCGASAH